VTGSVPAAGLSRDVDDALASPKGRRAADQPRRLGRGLGGVWQRVVARRSAGASWGGGVTASWWRVTRHPVLPMRIGREPRVRRNFS
jgi:hypothetical protein